MNDHSTYETLRHLADSWGLVFMVVTLAALVGWAFRPGSRAVHDDARMIPFRDEETHHER